MSELDSVGAEDSAGSSPSEREQSSFGIVQFGFHAKTSHDADEALLQTRSENYRAPPAQPDRDIWKRPPPDFRYLVYDPKPPKRNTVDSQQPWLYGTLPGQREKVQREKGGSLMPLIFRQRSSSPPHLVTRFHVDRPFTAKKRFVTAGMYPAGEYQSPKPHDYRQYPPIKSLGLDEFETNYVRDPYNIHFKTERLDVIHGLYRGPAERDLINQRQMAPPLSAKPKWDSQLILKKTPWPQKPEAYTRYRRRHRNPYSAFMERVERDVEDKWKSEKEQFESSLLQSDHHLPHRSAPPLATAENLATRPVH